MLGDNKIRAHLIDAARTFIFDTGLAPAAVGAARAALAVLQREPTRALDVLARASELADVTGAPSPESAVVSVVLGDPQRAFDAASACRGPGTARRMLPPAVGSGRNVTAASDSTSDAVSFRDGADLTRTSRGIGRCPRMSILLVTGTSTDVGKTVVTAALASLALQSGKSVAVLKPAPDRRRRGRCG